MTETEDQSEIIASMENRSGVKGEKFEVAEIKEEARDFNFPDVTLTEEKQEKIPFHAEDGLLAVLEAKKITVEGIEFVSRDDFDDLTGEIPSGKQVFERYLSAKRKFKKRTLSELGSLIRKELLFYWRRVLQREPSRINTTRMIKCMVDCFTSILLLQSQKSLDEDSKWELQKHVNRLKYLINQPFDISLPHERGISTIPKADEATREDLYRFLFEPPTQQEQREVREDTHSALGPISKLIKIDQTMDYFDDQIGRIENRKEPTPLDFAIALLREIMLNMHRRHPYRKKAELATLILHLNTRLNDFPTLYRFYTHLETEVAAGNIDPWREMEYDFISGIQEYLLDSADTGTVAFNADIMKKPVYEEFDLNDDNNGMSFDKKNSDDFWGDDGEDNKKNLSWKERIVKELYQKEDGDDGDDNPGTSAGGSKSRRGRPKKYVRHKPYGETKHGRSSWKQCQQCSYSTKTDTDLAKHMFDEHSHGSLCAICGYEAREFQEYEDHMKSHVLHCEECYKPLLGTKALRLHVSKYHSTKKRADNFEHVPCTVCGKMFRSVYLNTHIRNMHPEKPRDYFCKLCDYVTTKQSLLNLHVNNIHVKTTEPCPVCHKKFKEVRKHLLFSVCGGGPQVELSCEDCGRKFRQKQTLKKHVQVVHRNVKDKMCDECDYRTYSAFNLRLHKSKVHTKVSLTTICQICNEKTHSIEWHMKVYHPKKLEDLVTS